MSRTSHPDGDVYRGLEQFRRGTASGIGFCVARGRPYALEFANPSDVICLLLGDIATQTRFDADRARSLLFLGQSAAYHPGGGNVRVRADSVHHGFIAFSYPPDFQERFDDRTLAGARRDGSRNNIRPTSIRLLARFALARLRDPRPLESLEAHSLASLLYLETYRALGQPQAGQAARLSDREFAAVQAYVEAELASDLTCADLAAAADIPLRLLFEGFRQRTGMSPHHYIVERRIARACDLLQGSDMPIAEIAVACGFGSQQHLTSTFSARLGCTPGKIRIERRPAKPR